MSEPDSRNEKTDETTEASPDGRTYMDNPKACGAPEGWRWGYLPCGCRNDGYGRHAAYRRDVR